MWTAPVARAPIDAQVRVPGSKSATNRALVIAALASGPSRISGALDARDTSLMIAGLRALGVAFTCTPGAAPGSLDIECRPSPLTGPAHIDVGLAGTVMRFLPPLAALATGQISFDGDEQARVRPMSDLLAALGTLGAQITPGAHGLPFTVHGAGHLPGGAVRLDASRTSQFVSGLLLAAARFDRGVDIVHEGSPVPSAPHIEMTVQMLREHGVAVTVEGVHRWCVEPGPILPRERTIEPDLSNAGPFLAAAMATSGRVHIPLWPTRTTQAGDAFRGLLAAMGAEIALDTRGLTVTMSGPIQGIDVDLHDVGELTPTIAALCALAQSPSRLHGIGHLRGHETDRLQALAAELSGLGCMVEEAEDGLSIKPGALHGGFWRCYADHRMATAGAIIGLVVPGVQIDDIGCTTKTIPDFPGRWSSMLDGEVER